MLSNHEESKGKDHDDGGGFDYGKVVYDDDVDDDDDDDDKDVDDDDDEDNDDDDDDDDKDLDYDDDDDDDLYHEGGDDVMIKIKRA